MWCVNAPIEYRYMPRQSITISPPNDSWLRSQLESEEFSSKSEVVNDLIRQARRQEDVKQRLISALIDGEEATLERLRPKGASVALEAANPAYETTIFGPDRVAVQGRLVALVRRYD